MAEIANLNGVSIDPDEITGFNKDYLVPVTGSDGVTLPAFMAQIWAIYKAALGVVAPTWRTGAGVPSNALGINGDFYLSTSGNVFLKVAGAYVLQTNLAGPAGSGSTVHASQNGTGITVAPRSRVNFVGATVADNAGADRIDITIPSQATLRSARTSNTILAAADRGALIDITSGSFTQTFTAAATLGNGWFCYVRNSGSGDITVDPAGAETIDGLASFVMYPGETRLILCDGAAFLSMVLTAFSRLYTASATWTKPPGYAAFFVQGVNGGAGGGAGVAGTQSGNSGSGGDYYETFLPAGRLGAAEAVTIGAGGVGRAAGSGNQTQVAGGATSLGSAFTIAGMGNTVAYEPFVGGSSVTGTVTAAGTVGYVRGGSSGVSYPIKGAPSGGSGGWQANPGGAGALSPDGVSAAGTAGAAGVAGGNGSTAAGALIGSSGGGGGGNVSFPAGNGGNGGRGAGGGGGGGATGGGTQGAGGNGGDGALRITGII